MKKSTKPKSTTRKSSTKKVIEKVSEALTGELTYHNKVIKTVTNVVRRGLPFKQFSVVSGETFLISQADFDRDVIRK